MKIDLYEYVFNSDEEIPDKIIDVTGAVLTPCRPETCEGNGFHPNHEICCDECNWFLGCFPEFCDPNYCPPEETEL